MVVEFGDVGEGGMEGGAGGSSGGGGGGAQPGANTPYALHVSGHISVLTGQPRLG